LEEQEVNKRANGERQELSATLNKKLAVTVAEKGLFKSQINELIDQTALLQRKLD